MSLVEVRSIGQILNQSSLYRKRKLGQTLVVGNAT